MEKAMEAFMTYLHDADEKYQKYDEDRWKKDMELEEKRRHEYREHDIRVMRILCLSINRWS